jgi:hypothetical protein
MNANQCFMTAYCHDSFNSQFLQLWLLVKIHTIFHKTAKSDGVIRIALANQIAALATLLITDVI